MDESIYDPIQHGRRGVRCALAVLGAGLLLLASTAAQAGEAGGTAKEGGLGAAAAITSLVYGPAKVVYAAGGSVIAGMAWCFSGGDSEVASTILTRAVRGTYVITPATLVGQEEIEFVGRSPQYRVDAPGGAQVASGPDGW